MEGCGRVWRGVELGGGWGADARPGARAGGEGRVGGRATKGCMRSHQGAYRAPFIHIYMYMLTAASSGKQAHARCTMTATEP